MNDAMRLPVELADMLTAKCREGWAGTVTLHVKDGAILAFEVTEKHRISRDPREPASIAGGSRGSNDPRL
jgi:hypothetical protein